MRRVFLLLLAGLIGGWSGVRAQEKSPQTIKGPDERFKADILLVVAHPDDEGGVTPYLARAIYDEHKRVAVVYTTRGGSGGNDYSREHGPALADIREQEARQACAKLGITNVWFLDGKDTASQNVLNSLANWGHGANLEALVRIVRLTRPLVMISWLPGIFIGENHGDHQASGVLATEAFDLANDPTAFPAQVAGASKRLEIYLENLTPWQPMKLYFFSDADDPKQFVGTGPAYSIREISPSQRKPYWRLAMDAATPHLTQFPEDIQHLSKMSDDELSKMMSDPKAGWWPEPMTLTLGKSMFEGERTGCPKSIDIIGPPPVARINLGGAWEFYSTFYERHCVEVPRPNVPEIGIKAGDTLYIPIAVRCDPLNVQCDRLGLTKLELGLGVEAPAGWRVAKGAGIFVLPDGARAGVLVEIATPGLDKDELKKRKVQEVVVHASVSGKAIAEVRLRVMLRASALAQ
jgi:LmbE family N-acetylglucosaminyl deacetylase